MRWHLEDRLSKEGDVMLTKEGADVGHPLVFVRAASRGIETAERALRLGGLLRTWLSIVGPFDFFERLDQLDRWLSLDKHTGTAQLFLTKTKDGYEVGFARFGSLMQRTSKGPSLVEALLAAAKDVGEAIEADGQLPEDIESAIKNTTEPKE